MAESGQISRIWKRWKADARDDCFEVGADDMGLGIINLFTAPLMLGILMIIACLIALIECLWFKKFGNILLEVLSQKQIDMINQMGYPYMKRLKEIRTTFSYDRIIIQDSEYATEIFENK